MEIPTLGRLKPHREVPEWLVSALVDIPLLNGLKLSFTLDDLSDANEVEVTRAIQSFLRLTSADRLQVGSYLYENYRHVAGMIGEADLACKIGTEHEVWDHVHPTELFVSRRHRRDCAIYVQVAAECAWDPEHGIQIVYRHGKELSRVSGQDGHLTHADAYDLPEEEDRIA